MTHFPSLYIVAVVGIGLGFLLSNLRYSGQVDGLKEQIAVREQRIALANDQTSVQKTARDDAEKQFQQLKSESAAQPQLSARVEAVEAALARFAVASKAVEGALSATETSDKAEARGHVY